MAKAIFRGRPKGPLGKILVKLRLAPDYKRIPIFGIQAAGKSYFAFSLAQFLSHHRMGNVVGEGSDVVTRVLPFLLKGQPLDATVGNRDIDLMVEHISIKDYERVVQDFAQQKYSQSPLADESFLAEDTTGDLLPCKLLFSTNDLSGAEFVAAMQQLSEPNIHFAGEPLTKNFVKIIDQCDAAIAIIDLVRHRVGGQVRNRREMIKQALAEQVIPLIRGIELSVRHRNTVNRVFPLFLVFTKRDEHQLSREKLYEMVDEVFAIMMAPDF